MSETYKVGITRTADGKLALSFGYCTFILTTDQATRLADALIEFAEAADLAQAQVDLTDGE